MWCWSPTFAMRSSTETSLGSPHSGVDLAPKAGSKVVAPGNAVVALTAEAAGTGLVVLDHGFGLYTLLSGMDDVYVGEGESLRRGAVVGRMPREGKPLLHRVGPWATLGLNMVLTLGIAALSAWLPARRAARMGVTEALQVD